MSADSIPSSRAGVALFVALTVLAGCAPKLTRDDVRAGKPLLGFPSAPINRHEVEAWYRDVADFRSSSFDLDSPSPYVETALAPSSPYERVGLFLEHDSLRVAAVLSWLRKSDPLHATKGRSKLTLWGGPLEVTADAREFFAPGPRALLRLVNPFWQPPPEPRVRLPRDVPIKTATRTFYRDQLFALSDGRIWFKRNPAAGGTLDEPWRLFGDGLPGMPGGDDFERPKKIVRLSADGDALVAIDDRGRVYSCTTKSDSAGSTSGWSDGWGYPGKRPLFVGGRAANARDLAIGRRAQDVGWFEDAIGNRHNWGPMGTTTFYVLHRDGQEILYTDDGLPNDFSREMCGPDDGRFVAESLSASASALMVMDRYGRVFTRFDDYDLNGGTPNFEYTYRSEVRPDDDGTALSTALAPYFLPLAPWRWQESIPLTGDARLGRRITILQTGVGNGARELRVAGLGPKGKIGYFRKPIDAGAWTFVASPEVGFDAASMLDDADVARGAADRVASAGDVSRSSLPRGSSYRAKWIGQLRVPSAGGLDDLPDITAALDWNPYCPPARLTVTHDGVSFPATLHTVDFWTPATRHRPGFDGTPLMLLGTLVLDDAVLTDTRPAVRSVVARLRAYHQRTFALALVMDENRLDVRVIDDDFAKRHPLAMTLTRVGSSKGPDPAPSGLDAPRGSLEWLRSPALRRVAEAARTMAESRSLEAELQKDLAAQSREWREVDAFLDATSGRRFFIRALPVGRLSELTKLLSFERDEIRRAHDQARANVAAVVNEIDERIRRLEATTKH